MHFIHPSPFFSPSLGGILPLLPRIHMGKEKKGRLEEGKEAVVKNRGRISTGGRGERGSLACAHASKSKPLCRDAEIRGVRKVCVIPFPSRREKKGRRTNG